MSIGRIKRTLRRLAIMEVRRWIDRVKQRAEDEIALSVRHRIGEDDLIEKYRTLQAIDGLVATEKSLTNILMYYLDKQTDDWRVELWEELLISREEFKSIPQEAGERHWILKTFVGMVGDLRKLTHE